jgi:hypothetical protein
MGRPRRAVWEAWLFEMDRVERAPHPSAFHGPASSLHESEVFTLE